MGSVASNGTIFNSQTMILVFGVLHAHDRAMPSVKGRMYQTPQCNAIQRTFGQDTACFRLGKGYLHYHLHVGARERRKEKRANKNLADDMSQDMYRDHQPHDCSMFRFLPQKQVDHSSPHSPIGSIYGAAITSSGTLV